MKRCPTCKRTFEDDSLAYCLDDGSPLVAETGPDSEATLVSPSPSAPPPTLVSPYPPAVSPARPAPKRRVWPWVVGGLLVFFFFVVVIVAVIAIPQIVRKSRNTNRIVVNVPTPEPSETSSPQPEESPSPTSPTEAPTDEDVVQTQLTDLEKRWTQANIDGDKAALEQILADEYSGGDPAHNKRQYIDELKPDTAVKSWELEDLSVDLDGERATMTGYLKQTTTGGNEVYSFTDEFVWRDGRWQATGSRTVRVK